MVREEAKASCFGGNMCSFFRQKKATTRVVQQRLCTVQSFKAIIAALLVSSSFTRQTTLSSWEYSFKEGIAELAKIFLLRALIFLHQQ